MVENTCPACNSAIDSGNDSCPSCGTRFDSMQVPMKTLLIPPHSNGGRMLANPTNTASEKLSASEIFHRDGITLWDVIKNLSASSKIFRYTVYIGAVLMFILCFLASGIPTNYKLKSFAKNGNIEGLINHINKNIDLSKQKIKSNSVFLAIDLIAELNDTKGLKYVEQLYYSKVTPSVSDRIVIAFCNNNLTFSDIREFCNALISDKHLLQMIKLFDSELLYHTFLDVISDKIINPSKLARANTLNLNDALAYVKLYITNINSDFVNNINRLHDGLDIIRTVRKERDPFWNSLQGKLAEPASDTTKDYLQRMYNFYRYYHKDIALVIASHDVERAEQMINAYAEYLTTIDIDTANIKNKMETIINIIPQHTTELENIKKFDKEIIDISDNIKSNQLNYVTLDGYIIARVNNSYPQQYEINIGYYGNNRAVLVTTETEFSTRGRFTINVTKQGTTSVTLKEDFGSFRQNWDVYREVPRSRIEASKRENNKLVAELELCVKKRQQARSAAEKKSSEIKTLNRDIDTIVKKIYTGFQKNDLLNIFFNESPVNLPTQTKQATLLISDCNTTTVSTLHQAPVQLVLAR